MEIRILSKHGKGVREIAREVGVSRNTVRRYLRVADAARYRERPRQPGKLSAFEGYILQRLASALPDRLAATVLLRELRARGYARRGPAVVRPASDQRRRPASPHYHRCRPWQDRDPAQPGVP